VNPSTQLGADRDGNFQVLWEHGDRVFCRIWRRGSDARGGEAERALAMLGRDNAERTGYGHGAPFIEQEFRATTDRIPSVTCGHRADGTNDFVDRTSHNSTGLPKPRRKWRSTRIIHPDDCTQIRGVMADSFVGSGGRL
jgi:hypothetical protein